MLSPGEIQFIRNGVKENIRVDGRSRLDFRPIILETGLLPQANGSARLVLDGTDVLVGVKAELGSPSLDIPDQGRVEVSVECCPSASPEFEGKGGNALNLELGRILERSLSYYSILNLKSLCLIPGKQCWVLYVDALVLDSAGNLLDAWSIATRAAFSNTKIPVINVMSSENELELDSEHMFSIDVKNVPVCVTFTMIGGLYVADSTLEEESCGDSRVSFFVTADGNIVTVQSSGGSLKRESLHSMTVDASQVGKFVIEKVASILEEQSKKSMTIGFL
jgi:exosome complex component RRP42